MRRGRLQAGWHRFWTPLNGVVVYDHTAGYDLLKDIPVLFLTGPEIDKATVAAVRRCVTGGATCVVWAPLAKRFGIGSWTTGVASTPDGNGRWIITDDFGLSQVQEAIWPHIGRPDEMKYRFGDHTVVSAPRDRRRRKRRSRRSCQWAASNLRTRRDIEDLPVAVLFGVACHPVAGIDVSGGTVHTEVPGPAFFRQGLHRRGLKTERVTLRKCEPHVLADDRQLDEGLGSIYGATTKAMLPEWLFPILAVLLCR